MPERLGGLRARAASTRRALATVLAMCMVWAGPLPHVQAADINLPALGDAAEEDFSIGTERRLGEQIMREIRRDPDDIDDPLLLDYVQSIWAPLVARSKVLGHLNADLDQRFAWEVFLVRDPSINAFALPGGYVGVHLGLIAMTGSADELASVLAHELSHVTQRHIARSITNSKRQSLVSVAAMILGVLAASRANSPDAVNAVLAGSQAAAIQGQLNFSRDMEREADRVGLSVLSGAGFAPAGMAAMFEKLDQGSRLNDNNAFPYLRSHPLTTERIGEVRQRLGGGTLAMPLGSLEHALAQARARVLMNTRIDVLRRWQKPDAQTSGSPTEQIVAAYQAGLASTVLRDWDPADAAIARLQTLLTGNPRATATSVRWAHMLAAETLVERGDGARALQLLQNMQSSATAESRPEMMLRGQALLRAELAPDAPLRNSAQALRTWVSVHPNDAHAWTLLGQLWTKLGQPLPAIRADAETRLALGDLPGAIERLRAGQRQARGGGPVDFIEASVIDARLRDVQAELRRLNAEEREGR